jgi:hypothetical protein
MLLNIKFLNIIVIKYQRRFKSVNSPLSRHLLREQDTHSGPESHHNHLLERKGLIVLFSKLECNIKAKVQVRSVNCKIANDKNLSNPLCPKLCQIENGSTYPLKTKYLMVFLSLEESVTLNYTINHKKMNYYLLSL